MTKKEKLYLAISRAEGPGKCEYVNDKGEPRCVIAQLAILEGVTVEQMKQWGRMPIDTVIYGCGMPLVGSEVLAREYPVNLLLLLQRQWDAPLDPTARVDHHRLYMKQSVDMCYPE